MADEDFPDALPARYRLHWFVIERVLGQGGFGITYLAHDTNLDRRVAIKEYLPTEVARRRSDASARPRTETHNERYAWGLERFLSEARTLARFDHPNVVRVLSVFEANNTAYMVMRFEEGEDLATLLERRGSLPEEQLMSCLLPILDGLQLIHASGFIHRDIKPENIYLRQDGSPVLLDFGSARQSFGSAKTMTILVAPGYAPLEQYYGDAKSQGAWTDIYGLGATCYRAIAGRAPLDAIARAKGVLGSTRDILQAAAEVGRGRYSERLLAAVDHALQLSERNRPQNIGEWRAELVANAAEPAAGAGPASTTHAPPAQTSAPLTLAPVFRSLKLRWLWAAAALCVAVAAIVFVGFAKQASTATAIASAVPAATADETRPAVVPAAAPPLRAQPAPAPEPASPTAAASAAPIALTPPRVDPALSTGALGSPRAPQSSQADVPRMLALAKPSARREEPRRDNQAADNRLSRATAPTRSVVSSSVAGGASASTPIPGMAAREAATPTPSDSGTVPAATPAAAVTVAAAIAAPRARDTRTDAAEAAMRAGDFAAAARILGPLAAAGVSHAQVLLGQVRESRAAAQRSDFEAYVWYGIAARNGDIPAAASRDKLAARLQPAEVRQADQMIQRWKPRAEPAATNTFQERSSP